MLKILDVYIAKTLLATTALSLSVLIGLSALIKFIEQMKQVGRGSYDMTVALVYVLLSLPREVEQFFPMATLIGGLIGMGILASSRSKPLEYYYFCHEVSFVNDVICDVHR